jgi:predicted SnoaL-like aldol condensation-catalyzing enzyme
MLEETLENKNKTTVLEAFHTLFNRRDYAAAEKFWAPDYIQHASHLRQGRQGLFEEVRNLPPEFRWEAGVIMAEGDLVMVHGRYSGRGVATNWIAVDILRVKDGVFVEHWDVLQDEVSEAESKSGLPMFGTAFSY